MRDFRRGNGSGKPKFGGVNPAPTPAPAPTPPPPAPPPAGLVFAPPTTLNYTQGTADTLDLLQYVSGGTPGYSGYAVDEGTLPTGISIVGDDLIIGTGTTPGTYTGIKLGVDDSASAPAPAPGDLNVTFGVQQTTTDTNVPFTFSHVFKEAQVESTEYIEANLTDWQAIPITTWPDGSLRQAIISGRANCTANVTTPITLTASSTNRTGTALTETDLDTALTALGTNTLVIGAQTIDLDTLPGTSALHRTVFTGPICSYFIYRVAITGSNHLVAWFHCWVYKGGKVRVMPFIENAYFLVASPASDNTRTYVFTFNGNVVYSATPLIPHHSRIALFSGDPDAAYWSTASDVMPVFDVGYLRDTKMFPNAQWRDPADVTLNALQTTYSPNTLAQIDTNMGDGGTSASVLSKGQMFYIGCGDKRTWKNGLVHDLSGGSWSSHYRNGTGTTGPDNEPFVFTDYPSASIQVQDTPTVPTGTGTTNGTHVVSHQPPYGYFGWLLTGNWWFLEEMLFWGGYNYLINTVPSRLNASGVIRSNAGANTDRGMAWALRTLAQSVVSMPTTHPCYADRKASWEANMAFYNGVVITGTITVDGMSHVNNLGLFPGYGGFTQSQYQESNISNWDTVVWGAGWQQHMIHSMLGFTWDLNLPQTGTSKTHHQAIRDHGYKMVIAKAGDGQSGRWSYRSFATYATPFGTVGGTYFNSWNDAWTAYQTGIGATISTSSEGLSMYHHTSTTVFTKGMTTVTYGGMALMALTYAKDHGATGVTDAWRRVSTASNFDQYEGDDVDNNDPSYMILPRT